MQKTTSDQGNQNSDSLSNHQTVIKNQNPEATKTYTCSMHPEVMSDRPGKCPKCNMELLIKK